MKKILSITALAFLMFGFTACDVIEEPYKKENNTGGGGNENPEAVVKHVLLEDYTGVRCNNCPAAGEIALQLQEQYEHKVIVLSVHSGFLSNPIGGYPNFKTTEGEEWYSFFGFDSNPIGTVNRKLNSGTYAFNSTEWADAVATALQEEALLEMTATTNYNDANRELKVDVTSTFLAELPDTYSLTVCIMEDNVVGKQLKPDGDDPNYVHRHVFRKAINGTWGEEINTTAIAPEDVITKSYTTTLDAAYNADNCHIVAYVSNSATKEVLQVIEKKIK